MILRALLLCGLACGGLAGCDSGPGQPRGDVTKGATGAMLSPQGEAEQDQSGSAQISRAGGAQPSLVDGSQPAQPPGAEAQGKPLDPPDLRWTVQQQAESARMTLTDPKMGLHIAIACRNGRLHANVPEFTLGPGTTRMRLRFGEDEVPLDIVPLAPGEKGISAAGAMPSDLDGMFAHAGGVQAEYGDQSMGPAIPPPADSYRAFLAACR